MKKVFISQPMRGRTEEDILKERSYMIDLAKERCGADVEVLDTYFADFDGRPLAFIAKSIMALAETDVAVFAKGWEGARGCRIEHLCCKEYGVDIMMV